MPADLNETSCPRCGKKAQIPAASKDNGRKCPACGAALGEPEANLQTAVASGSPAPVPTAAKAPAAEALPRSARPDSSSRLLFLGMGGCAACVGVAMIFAITLISCMLFTWQKKPADVKPDPPEIFENDARFVFLDLRSKGNFGRTQGYIYKSNHFAELPLGAQKLADVPFRVQERYMNLADAKEITDLGVDCKFRRLHVCHGAHFYGSDKKPIASYVLRYEDGAKAELPVYYRRDVVNFWGSDGLPREGKIAWKGRNEAAAAQACPVIYLFLTTYANPHPDKTVRTIDYVRGQESRGGPIAFCIAMTAEKD